MFTLKKINDDSLVPLNYRFMPLRREIGRTVDNFFWPFKVIYYPLVHPSLMISITMCEVAANASKVMNNCCGCGGLDDQLHPTDSQTVSTDTPPSLPDEFNDLERAHPEEKSRFAVWKYVEYPNEYRTIQKLQKQAAQASRE